MNNLFNPVNLFNKMDFLNDIFDIEKANSMNADISKILHSAEEELEKKKEDTYNALKRLGRKKIEIFTEGSLNEFLSFARLFKDMPDYEMPGIYEDARSFQKYLAGLDELNTKFKVVADRQQEEGLKNALLGLAALGTGPLLLAAETKKIMSSLSDSVKDNATLAWLGGGTLMLGNMAGVMLLCGVVFHPEMLMRGIFLKLIGGKSLEKVRENRDKAEAWVKEAEGVCKNLDFVSRIADRMTNLLTEMDAHFFQELEHLKQILPDRDDYRSLDKGSRDRIKNCFLYSRHLKDIVDMKLMEQDGSPLPDVVKNIEDHEKFLKQMLAM